MARDSFSLPYFFPEKSDCSFETISWGEKPEEELAAAAAAAVLLLEHFRQTNRCDCGWLL